jgi:polyhydroxybutyrate depolymerase
VKCREKLWASLAVFAVGCSSNSEPTSERPEQITFGGDRPTTLHVPDDYDHSQPTPLLMVLHGYRASSFLQLSYTRTRDLPDQVGTLMLAPEGTIGGDGYTAWNASEICCGDVADIDDVGYLTGLVDEVSAVWNVDPDRIYIFGHSNGGFMAYRLACERSDLFAGIASLAGMGWTGCDPSQKVSVLQIHGTEDESVAIDGGVFDGGAYLSAQGSLDAWSDYNSCGDDWQSGGRLDIDGDLEGEETAVTHNADCKDVGVELWKIEGGAHIPGFNEAFPMELWDWFASHPKP